MHPHRGLEVALLTKRNEPRQIFGCDTDPTDPWPLQLHMAGPWTYTGWIVPGDTGDIGYFRPEWQVHTDVVPYKEYPWHPAYNTHPGDPRVLLPRGTGNCKTYSLISVRYEGHGGELYFRSRMLASPPGSLGAWDFSWTTTIVSPGGNSNDILLNIWADERRGVVLKAFDGYLHFSNSTPNWVPLAPWPALPQGEYTRTVEFRCLLARSWCRVHVNGATHTLDYGDTFPPFARVTVALVGTRGIAGAFRDVVPEYGRSIQVSDIAVVAAPANKHIPYPFED